MKEITTMKRKMIDKLRDWKDRSNGESAILVRGARRVGKSYIVEEFAKTEYKSYILIDFNLADEQVNRRTSMIIDYSKFERDESLYGEVTVKDFDGSEITIKAELV